MVSVALDVLVVLILVSAVVIGHKRGLIKSLTKLLAFVAAIAVAVLFSLALAGLVYDHTVAPSIRETLTDKIGTAGNTIESNIDGALENVPGFIRNALDNKGLGSGEQILSVTGKNMDAAALADKITVEVIRPVAVPLLRAICFVLLFVVALIAALIVLRLLRVVFRLPLLKQFDKSLGAVAGALSGLLLLLVFISVLQLLAATGKPDGLINAAVIDKTWLVKTLINLNPLGGALRDVMQVAAK